MVQKAAQMAINRQIWQHCWKDLVYMLSYPIPILTFKFPYTSPSPFKTSPLNQTETIVMYDKQLNNIYNAIFLTHVFWQSVLSMNNIKFYFLK